MEDMLWRFPHIGEQIFKKLSNKNIAKCRKVAKSWEHFIVNQRFYKQKVKFEMVQKQRTQRGWTELHLLAKFGNLSNCKEIVYNVEDKNPMDDSGTYTPLHIASCGGYYEVCKLIVNNVDQKILGISMDKLHFTWLQI